MTDGLSATRGLRGWSRVVSFRVFCLVFLGLHAAKVARLIPLQTLLDHQPLVEYRHSAAYGDLVRDRAFRASGSAWGYDPYVGGGMATGLGLTPSSTLPILLDRLLLRWLPPDASYKAFVALALIAGPFLLFAAARALRFSPEASLLAAALVSSGMVSHDAASRLLIYHGEVSFWLGAFLGIYNAAVLYGGALHAHRRWEIGFVASAVLLPAADPALALLQIVPWVAIPLMGSDASRRRTAAVVAAAVVAAFAVNVRWLVPFVESRLVAPARTDWAAGGLADLAKLWLPAEGNWKARLHAGLRAAALASALAGTFHTLRDKRRLNQMLWLVSGAALLVAVFGTTLGLPPQGDWSRFLFPATLILLLPASAFLSAFFLRRGTTRVFLFGWYLWFSLTWQLVNRYDPVAIRADLTPREHRLLTDLDRLPSEGRVLVQYAPSFTDGLRLASLGGRQRYAGFADTLWASPVGSRAAFEQVGDDWFLFGRPLRLLSENEVVAQFRMNGLSDVVVTTSFGRRFFSRLSAFEERPSLGNGAYWIYRLRDPRPTTLLAGHGRVRWGYNRLRIEHASAGVLLTNFRWTPDLRASAGAPVRAVRLPGGRVPYVAIDNPTPDATVEVRLVR